VAVVEVRRSGGFLGRTVSGAVDLDAVERPDADPRLAEVRALLATPDLAAALAAAPKGPPQPDRFVYTFTLPGHPSYTIAEQHLTPDLHRLAALVLPAPDR
jgi:hypothetical protein